MKSIVKESWNLNKKTNTKAKTKCHAIHKNAFIISNPFLADQEQKGDIHLDCRMRRNYKAKAFNTPPLCIRPFYKRNIKCRTHSDAESSFLQTHIQWKVSFFESSALFRTSSIQASFLQLWCRSSQSEELQPTHHRQKSVQSTYERKQLVATWFQETSTDARLVKKA